MTLGDFRLRDIPMQKKLSGLLVLSGVIPVLLVGITSVWLASTSLFEQNFQQLHSVQRIKHSQLERYFADRKHDLDVLAQMVGSFRKVELNKQMALNTTRKHQVESYLKTIQSQMLTFSQNRMVVDAMREFPAAFRKFREENGITAAKLPKMRQAVQGYYEREFSPVYRKLNDDNDPQVQSRYAPLDHDSLALQYHYIAINPNALGEKDNLDRALDRSRYSQIHGTYHPVIRQYLREFGYYDIFLVDSESGDIVYSVFKELDYSTSLIDGPYADTNFAEAFRKANDATNPDTVVTVDFKNYWPSYEAPAAFVASPVFDGGRKVGVAIFQFPVDRLNEIMTNRTGLGETGETYLVGPDKLMRSDSVQDPEHHSLAASFRHPETGRVDTPATTAALAGKPGSAIIRNYHNNNVLSVWSSLEFGDARWAVLAESDIAEIFNPKNEKNQEFFAEYKKLYGYYDLFLIDPSGYIFYTVEHEPDYKTNILTGPYANSNLGRLIKQVIRTKEFGFADFAPYAPSNDAPAAFIAEPVVGESGELEVIVALQLPLDTINGIMQEREGMGSSGETYLVGPDRLMRSDSFLDPEGHSVVASFAGTVANNGVDTRATQQALAGHGGDEVITDYNGNAVLSVYSPLSVFGVTWALIAEIDRAEVLMQVLAIPLIILVLAALAVAVLWLVARSVSADITNPLDACIDALRSIAEQGDLRTRVEVNQKDEVGQMANTLEHMVERLNTSLHQVSASAGKLSQESRELSDSSHTLSERTTEQAASLEEASSTLSQLADQTSSNKKIADQADEMTRSMTNSASKGSQQMKDFSTSMDEITKSTQDISQIIGVISEIAFQTKMLAINASIEAARAGEHGKGFAVVAEEIQGLAKNTADSAEEIKKLITASVQRVNNSSTVMDATVGVLDEIVASADSTAALMSEIRIATEDQDRGVSEINVAMEQMASITNHNSISAEKNANTSNQLLQQASDLGRVVAQFQLSQGNAQPLLSPPPQPPMLPDNFSGEY